MESGNRAMRILGLYSSLINGQLINKADEASRYSVNDRTIQRDLDEIRAFLELSFMDTGVINTVIYDHSKRGYRLEKPESIKLVNDEMVMICKILLKSREFAESEMMSMIDKLIACCVPEKNKKMIFDIITNERLVCGSSSERLHIIE